MAGKLEPQRGGADREVGGGVSRRETATVWVCQVSPSCLLSPQSPTPTRGKSLHLCDFTTRQKGPRGRWEPEGREGGGRCCPEGSNKAVASFSKVVASHEPGIRGPLPCLAPAPGCEVGFESDSCHLPAECSCANYPTSLSLSFSRLQERRLARLKGRNEIKCVMCLS